MKNISNSARVENTATIAAGLLVFHYLLVINKGGENLVLFYSALIILLSGLFIKPLGNLITYLWTKLADGLGWVNSRVVLFLVFYFFLTPFAWLFRLFNNDNLSLKKKKHSYFEERNHTFTKKDLENIW